MNLRATLHLVKKILNAHEIPFALIGGMALSAYMEPRTTFDLDFLVDFEFKEKLKEILVNEGFKIDHEGNNVMQFSGAGMVDVIFAQKELSKKMLKNAQLIDELQVHVVLPEDIIGLKIQAFCNDSSRELRDKADIYGLMKNLKNLDIQKIKMYADIFGKWTEIEDLWKKR